MLSEEGEQEEEVNYHYYIWIILIPNILQPIFYLMFFMYINCLYKYLKSFSSRDYSCFFNDKFYIYSLEEVKGRTIISFIPSFICILITIFTSILQYSFSIDYYSFSIVIWFFYLPFLAYIAIPGQNFLHIDGETGVAKLQKVWLTIPFEFSCFTTVWNIFDTHSIPYYTQYSLRDKTNLQRMNDKLKEYRNSLLEYYRNNGDERVKIHFEDKKRKDEELKRKLEEKERLNNEVEVRNLENEDEKLKEEMRLKFGKSNLHLDRPNFTST